MVKINYLFAILFVGTTFSAEAQIRSFLKSVDELEVLAGPSLVSIYNDNITKDIREPKIGYIARLGLLHNLSKKFSLNTSFSFERKGHRTIQDIWYYDPTIDFDNCKCTTSLGELEFNVSRNYLMLSISIRSFIISKYIFLELGPYAGYLASAKYETIQLWNNSSKMSSSISEKRYDFGVSLVIGFQNQISEDIKINIQLLGNYGLYDITYPDLKTTTNSVVLIIGINYQINKSVNL